MLKEIFDRLTVALLLGLSPFWIIMLLDVIHKWWDARHYRVFKDQIFNETDDNPHHRGEDDVYIDTYQQPWEKQ